MPGNEHGVVRVTVADDFDIDEYQRGVGPLIGCLTPECRVVVESRVGRGSRWFTKSIHCPECGAVFGEWGI